MRSATHGPGCRMKGQDVPAAGDVAGGADWEYQRPGLGSFHGSPRRHLAKPGPGDRRTKVMRSSKIALGGCSAIFSAPAVRGLPMRLFTDECGVTGVARRR